MYDVGFIEKYGSGIYMINELCKEWGIPRPEYELSEVETKVIFRSSGKAIVISEIEKLGVELNERQREGLKIIFEKGRIINADYAKMFKISRNTVTNDLSNLVEKGLIKRVGRGRGSYYAPKI
jgi:ATP-dependent DNA helicase RecG